MAKFLTLLLILCSWPVLNGLHAQAQSTEDFTQYGIYRQTAPYPLSAPASSTQLPIEVKPNTRITYIGNTLLDRARHFGYLEMLLHQRYPDHQLVVRNLAWSADTPQLQPRPDNFADQQQHLRHERTGLIIAAYGFNESFGGRDGEASFRDELRSLVQKLRTRAYDGQRASQIVLLSPIANENLPNIPAADQNNEQLERYAAIVQEVAKSEQVGFIDLFHPTRELMQRKPRELTLNGIHLTESGYEQLAKLIYTGLFHEAPPAFNANLRDIVLDKNRQFFRRYRPANTFYYTGGRNKQYGYLDFLPAMRNFDLMVANRDQQIWSIARGTSDAQIDDSNVPRLPLVSQSRGANRWMPATEELAEFKIDPRFDVSLFAGEEQFPELAAPIQMRWDGQGRLWVSCSTTYPHVYPGSEPNDKLIILEDTDNDGRADKSTVFAEGLHIPLSFVLGDGGVYVSEPPHLTFLQDTDGDGRADSRRRLLTGFGTEDSHHALHDFVWSPDGDLVFREAVFHHTQVETPYGPVRQRNSGWFRFTPRTHRLLSFGTYSSTNPWGVTFDRWGQHVASHPIFASAFHATDPPYPDQHPKPVGLQAYSGTCGQEFVDFSTFPEALQGRYIKIRYKPTNRVEIHRWEENEFGYTETYEGDLIFSTNLSFIPVDIRFGPRGALFICDWYNPIKGHAQYSLRDDRRDRHSGRIWRVTAKEHALQRPPKFAGETTQGLVKLLGRPEYRYRYWAKRELRSHNPDDVVGELKLWLDEVTNDRDFLHHQLEALWVSRMVDRPLVGILEELLSCQDHRARAAATRQLRYLHSLLPDSAEKLRRACNDPNGLVRLEAVNAASYIGTREALDAVMEALAHPHGAHLTYAITCALGSESLRQHWQRDPTQRVVAALARIRIKSQLSEPTPSADQAQFDTRPNLKEINIACRPERMKFDVEQFAVTTGQPVKLVLVNPDATDHNLVIVQPGKLEEVGIAANEMARNPRFANSNFIPREKRHLILHATPMIGPTRRSRVHVLRFTAPDEPGIYPFVCTFPGHWVAMRGDMVVAESLDDVESILAARKTDELTTINEWSLADFSKTINPPSDDEAVLRGMHSFAKARCDQCHRINGYGINLGPELTKISERFKGRKLLEQILAPSTEIHQSFRNVHFTLRDGRTVSGIVQSEDETTVHLLPNLLQPDRVLTVNKSDIETRATSDISSMPTGLIDVLTKPEIFDLLGFLEAGGIAHAHER